MFGLTAEKIIVILVIAAVLIGPERLPAVAAQLARLVGRVRLLAKDLEGRAREELGPEFDEVDWKQLDPRRYDPRRIVRSALADEVADVKAAFDFAADADPRSQVRGLSLGGTLNGSGSTRPTSRRPRRAGTASATSVELPDGSGVSESTAQTQSVREARARRDNPVPQRDTPPA
jgi:sec-independent protein translocase protein TatB